MYSISFEILFQKYKNIAYNMLLCDAHAMLHMIRVAVILWYAISCCAGLTRSYFNLCVFIQSNVIAYLISDVAYSMLHWCKTPQNPYAVHIRLSLGALKSSYENIVMVFLISVLPLFCIRETIHCLSSLDFRENY